MASDEEEEDADARVRRSRDDVKAPMPTVAAVEGAVAVAEAGAGAGAGASAGAGAGTGTGARVEGLDTEEVTKVGRLITRMPGVVIEEEEAVGAAIEVTVTTGDCDCACDCCCCCCCWGRRGGARDDGRNDADCEETEPLDKTECKAELETGLSGAGEEEEGADNADAAAAEKTLAVEGTETLEAVRRSDFKGAPDCPCMYCCCSCCCCC